MRVKLRDIAHGRAGDKGDISTVSVIVFDPVHFPVVRDEVTASRVAAWLGDLVAGPITRFELPGIGALNFVMQRALGGGVTRSLALDAHGKSRSTLLLEMEIDLPDGRAGAGG